MTAKPKARIESAVLVQLKEPGQYELRRLELEMTCFSTYTRAGKLLERGSKDTCETAARLLGYRIDVIEPDL